MDLKAPECPAELSSEPTFHFSTPGSLLAGSFTVMPPGFLRLVPPALSPGAVDTTPPHPFRGYWALGNGSLSENQDVVYSLKLPLK